jgi:pimeloyl-ACP methyl ester carboxylesterase
MSTFVIVHGAWGGGWEWSPVADILRGSGHRVFTPTLSGMGERAHLAVKNPIGLSTHIADIVSLVQFERLRDVIPCGASYGGMPATGAADQQSDRVRLLVYVDGLVPVDGRSALDLLPQDFAGEVRVGWPRTARCGPCPCRRSCSTLSFLKDRSPRVCGGHTWIESATIPLQPSPSRSTSAAR